MIDTPEIVQTTAQQTALIHLTIARGEMRTVMGPGIEEVMAAVKTQGIGPSGPWFTHHLTLDPVNFDFEICVPVSAPVAAVGRVMPGLSPAMTVVRTVYRGSFEGLGAAWAEFNAWVAANGHEPGEDFYERYVAGPESSPNPADWRTELSRPLRG